MKFMSFREWIKNNPDMVNYNKYQECPECHGVGQFEERDEYDNIAEFYCYYCDGEGEIDETYEEYERQLRKDKMKYEKYLEIQNQVKGE